MTSSEIIPVSIMKNIQSNNKKTKGEGGRPLCSFILLSSFTAYNFSGITTYPATFQDAEYMIHRCNPDMDRLTNSKSENPWRKWEHTWGKIFYSKHLSQKEYWHSCLCIQILSIFYDFLVAVCITFYYFLIPIQIDNIFIFSSTA